MVYPFYMLNVSSKHANTGVSTHRLGLVSSVIRLLLSNSLLLTFYKSLATNSG